MADDQSKYDEYKFHYDMGEDGYDALTLELLRRNAQHEKESYNFRIFGTIHPTGGE